MPSPNVQIVFGAIDAGMSQSIRAAQRQLEGLRATAAGLAGAFVGLQGIHSVDSMFQRAISTAAADESLQQQLRAVTDSATEANAAWSKLVQTEGETAIGRDQLAIVSRQLMETGQSAAQAADMTERLAVISRASGESINSIALAYEHVAVRGEATIDDLFRLSRIGVPQIGALAQQFFQVQREVKASELALKEETRSLQRHDEELNRQEDAFEGVAQKIGLVDAVYRRWVRSFGSSSVSVGGAFRGMGAQADALAKTFSAGFQQLERELNVSEQTLKGFFRSGVLGAGDVLAAQRRNREEQQRHAREMVQDQQMANQARLLQQQVDSAHQVRDLIADATNQGGALAKRVKEALQTWNGMLDQLKRGFDEVFRDFGQPLMEGLKPALQALQAQLQAIGPIARDVGTRLGNAAKTFVGSLEDGSWAERLRTLAGSALTAAALIGAQAFNAMIDSLGEGDKLDRFAARLTKTMYAAGEALGAGAEATFANSPIGQLMREGERANTPQFTANYRELATRNTQDFLALGDAEKMQQARDLAKRYATPGQAPDEIALQWAIREVQGNKEVAEKSRQAAQAFNQTLQAWGDVADTFQKHFSERFNDPKFKAALQQQADAMAASSGQGSTSFAGVPANPVGQSPMSGPAPQPAIPWASTYGPAPGGDRTPGGQAAPINPFAGQSGYDPNDPGYWMDGQHWYNRHVDPRRPGQWMNYGAPPILPPTPPSLPDAGLSGASASSVPNRLDSLGTKLDQQLAVLGEVKDLLSRVLSGGGTATA